MNADVIVRSMNPKDYEWVQDKVDKSERRIKTFKIQNTIGYVAEKEKDLVGVALMTFKNSECEILFLESFSKGVGSVLLETVKEKSKETNCRTIWRVLGSDNPALDFYKAKGFDKCINQLSIDLEQIELIL